MKYKLTIVFILVIAIGALIGWLVSFPSKTPERKNFIIKARQYSYDPPKIEVNKGDTLHLKLVSLDVVHGFFLEAYDIDCEIHPNIKTFKFRKPSEGHKWKDTSEIVVIANKTGKFRYRCSHTCGNMHPFMMGEMIVSPNYLLNISIGITIGFVLGLLYLLYNKAKNVK